MARRGPYMTKQMNSSGPVEKALEIVGDRWSFLILLDLLRGLRRFSEFRQSLPNIATNVLSNRLKLLERHEIVERKLYSQHPPRAEYLLTRKGHELGVVAGALASWGSKHLPGDTDLVHTSCGTPLRVAYYCEYCQAQLPGAEVRLERSKRE